MGVALLRLLLRRLFTSAVEEGRGARGEGKLTCELNTLSAASQAKIRDRRRDAGNVTLFYFDKDLPAWQNNSSRRKVPRRREGMNSYPTGPKVMLLTGFRVEIKKGKVITYFPNVAHYC